MRTIGAFLAVVVVAALAPNAPAGDPPPKKDDVRVYSEEEWLAKVREIESIDVVGVKKSAVLTREAAKCAIRVRVKLWDVRQTKDGCEIDVVDVVPAPKPDPGRLPRDPIVLPALDRETVATWKRWDRLAFKVKAKVSPDGALIYTREVRVADDIVRTPNPGVEYPPIERSVAKADSYRDFVERYARACAVPDWKTAWRWYGQATAIDFPVACVVRDALPGQLSRGTVKCVFDITEPLGPAKFGLFDAQGHPRTWAAVDIHDPQIAEALKPGAKAELRLHVTGFNGREDLEVREGRFRVETAFGRLR